MRTPLFESPVSIRLTADDGTAMSFSALLERDPKFLNWNRFSLLGTKQDKARAMRLFGKSPVAWEMHSNTPLVEEEENISVEVNVSGVAILRGIGWHNAWNIADGSIQKFCYAEIISFKKRYFRKTDKKEFCSFLFLQRPYNWTLYDRRQRFHYVLNVEKGTWKRIPRAGLQMRLISHRFYRNDDRLTNEVELLSIPGIEFSSSANRKLESHDTQYIFHIAKAMIAFCYRQYVTNFLEIHSTENEYTENWSSVEISPINDEPYDSIFSFKGQFDEFIAKAIGKILEYKISAESIHAATFGYAGSYHSPYLDTSISMCMEGIERLLTLFENNHSISRETIKKEKWKSVYKDIKRQIESFDLGQRESAAVMRSLKTAPNLSFQDRIERMAERLGCLDDFYDSKLFSNLEKLILVRNSIVHGRMITDSSSYFQERERAQRIFETLLLRFIGLH